MLSILQPVVDFTGIYTKNDVSGSYQGNHFIKFIGYGTSGGVDYWLCANSWGTSFGDKGYFKMQKGIDLCGIETYVYEGFAEGQKQRSVERVAVQNHTFDDEHPISGHWVNQEDLSAPFLQEAISAAVSMINAKRESVDPVVFQKLISAETQVVSGLNIKLHLRLLGMTAEVTLFRDLERIFHLEEFVVKF